MEQKYKEFQTAVKRFQRKIAYPWKFVVKKLRARACLAEFLGTFILCTIGNCAIAQAVLSGAPGSDGGPYGSFQTINLGYALGLVIGVYVAVEASGAHLNPAVSWAMALKGNLSWFMLFPYMISQTIGAFFSSAVVYGVYHDGIHNISINGTLGINTAGIFATYPREYLTLGNGFFDQLLGTFFLVIGIIAITDTRNHIPDSDVPDIKIGFKPFLIGVVFWAVGTCLGINSGYAINPARDFGPRIFTAMAGWGKQVFECCSEIPQWWWVPVIAPFIGASLAVFVYWSLIKAHHPTKESWTPNDDEIDEEGTPNDKEMIVDESGLN